jgi:hypothetical protein
MAVVIPSTPPSPPSPQETPATLSDLALHKTKSAPIDPFSINITSWEQWSTTITPSPRPSTSLQTPPKVELFCISSVISVTYSATKPLPFTPRRQPGNLTHSETSRRQGPINLFDKKPFKQTQSQADGTIEMMSGEIHTDEGRLIENGIPAPVIHDNKEFEFDWPSEEIKWACEELFPGNKEWSLPVLNWIAKEDEDNQEGEVMGNIQR